MAKAEVGLPLACTVRACARPLLEIGSTLVCPQGHAFDRVRDGYWNLLQPQDRRSQTPGDADETVRARARWLSRGFVDGLADAIAATLTDGPTGVVVDLGCGEGYFARRLFASGRATVCGVDLSATAIRSAARAWPQATWVVANADRFIPLLTDSCELALSIFGRRPVSELRRIARADGRVVVAIPAADDLIELRYVAAGRGELRERVAGVVEELGAAFRLAGRTTWRERAGLNRSDLEDALAMTYRGARRIERERLAGVSELTVTLSAEILEFVL